MKSIIVTLFTLTLAIVTVAQNQTDWANYGRYEEANKEQNGEIKAVFMGNSITQGWYSIHPNFFSENNFVGRGIGGQTTAHMLVRFQSDVVALSPEYVVILAGTNDLARNNGYVSPEHIVENIKSMCEIAMYNDIKPIVCSILPVYEYGWCKELGVVAELVEDTNTLLKRYAKSAGVKYVDYHSKMKDERGGLPTSVSGDGVHLNSAGYDQLEAIITKAIK